MAERTSVDDYIDQQPGGVRDRLGVLRALVKEIAPAATEKISWGMPSFSQHGVLVQFAAHKSHIGFYPGPEAIEHFAAELAGFKWAKGSVQFPNSKPLPLDLVRKMVEFRVLANDSRSAWKR